MASQTYNGSTWTYSYNNAGLRTSRSNGSVTYHYIYNGDKLTQMTIADEVNNTQQVMDFTYDANGQLLTMTYDEEVYYYILSLQGDVAGITDSQGNRLIDFHYEGYGAGYYTSYDTEKAALLAQINPFGYRSYVMDLGTGMYYLQSRYYDPTLGRFINADNIISTDSVVFKNLYSYCENNPIMGYDPTGHWNWRGFWTGVGVAALGIGLVVLSVVTFGAAAPLAVGVGVAVGVALTGTGIVTSYAAAAEKTMVLDVSTTNGTTHDKTGYSVVIDFDTDTAGVETYYHYGKTSDGYGAAYSFGLVSGYEEPGDYGGFFADAGATYSHKGFNYGVDICTDPTAPFQKCYAVSGTVGISFPNSLGGKMSGYAGIDYYLPVSYIEWG